ncbi:MAG TPA: pirin family protein [Mycobacteriales bacterium]|nr:pirin family protein [Mycobacteriales bacterium]
MSGPVDDVTAPPTPDCGRAAPPIVEVSDARAAEVGSTPVRRALPQRSRRTVGPWCFADHFGPLAVTDEIAFDIGPHPHMGLATATWLHSGELVHHDSLGSEQPLRPGELNLMTSGFGISHSEERSSPYRGEIEGIQLWLALPDMTRNGEAWFAHHGDLPQTNLGSADATVVVGAFNAVVSPAIVDWPTAGADIALRGGDVEVPLEPAWEYALVVMAGRVAIGETTLVPGRLGYVGAGRDELRIAAAEPARLMLLGGQPFESPIVMWWNFVARSTDELDAAYRSWFADDERFGVVASDLARIAAPAPYWRRS